MRMNREMYWRFDAVGNPDVREDGHGTMIAALRALADWLIRSHVQERITIVFAKEKDRLVDKRKDNGGIGLTTAQAIDEAFAGLDLDSGIE